MSIASPFSLSVVAITILALLGMPIGLSMIAGSALYLFLVGADMGIVAEQFLNGMYSNYVILAVPLFILAAEFMNVGSMTERLLDFCNVLVGRFRGGLAQINIVQSIIFAGMSGSAIADAAGSGRMMQKMMTRDGRFTMRETGELVTLQGYPVLDPGGTPLVLDPLAGPPEVGADGMLQQNGQPVGAIGLFSFVPGPDSIRYGNSGFLPNSEPQPLVDMMDVGVVQGFVEESNVNPVEEMMRLIQVQRTFEQVTALMRDSDNAQKEAIKTMGG